MSTRPALLQTSLHQIHLDLGARMVEFSGWEMPLLYTDIKSEHEAVRKHAGLFDLGHMGRVRFKGRDAVALADLVQTASVASLKPGRTRYGLVCTASGTIVDDVLISREEDGILVVVNAGNRETDLALFRTCAQDLQVEIVDETERLAMIAVQGRLAASILEQAGLGLARKLRYYGFMTCIESSDPFVVSRTGYTGEDGFELLLPQHRAAETWTRMLEAGGEGGLIPCGLGCRDTLRLEAGMPLFGHEISRDINPFEAGLDFAVKFNHSFQGHEALQEIQAQGARRRLLGLIVEGPRIPRQGCSVLADGAPEGVVCSGTRSPTLDLNIATALVASSAAESDRLEVDIRGHRVAARRSKLPFYRRKDMGTHGQT